jgi:hypothetical protein
MLDNSRQKAESKRRHLCDVQQYKSNRTADLSSLSVLFSPCGAKKELAKEVKYYAAAGYSCLLPLGIH